MEQDIPLIEADDPSESTRTRYPSGDGRLPALNKITMLRSEVVFMSEAKRGMSRMTVITGEERRRRWSDEDRDRILAAIAEPGAVIAEVARRADVCTSLVYKWRKEARRSVSAPGFARVVVDDAASGAATSPPDEIGPAAILVRLKDVRVGMHAPPAVIAATLKALRS